LLMVMGPKAHKKKDELDYRKVLDKSDPFDQLIMEFGRGGVLDIGVVAVGQDRQPEEATSYNKKVLPSKGRHSS
jgi:hypothetical protein